LEETREEELRVPGGYPIWFLLAVIIRIVAPHILRPALEWYEQLIVVHHHIIDVVRL